MMEIITVRIRCVNDYDIKFFMKSLDPPSLDYEKDAKYLCDIINAKGFHASVETAHFSFNRPNPTTYILIPIKKQDK